MVFLEFVNALQADTVFDIGANVGIYAILSTLAPSVVRVDAFEAAPDTFAELSRNVRVNRLDQRIRCFDQAVSSESGSVEFSLSDPLSGINGVSHTSLHDQSLYHAKKTVPCVRMDEHFVETGRRLALKIDVEGHEHQVLLGAERLLKNNRCVIQMEIYENAQARVLDLMKDFGFQRVFGVEHDHYFTNDPGVGLSIVGLLERAMGRLVDCNFGKWPSQKKLSGALDVETSRDEDGSVLATCRVDPAVFSGPLEFAWYLNVNGKRVQTIWYPGADHVRMIPREEDCSDGCRLTVSGFVREKDNPDRKLMKTVPVRGLVL